MIELSDEVKKKIDNLTQEEVSRNRTFYHELAWYGTESFAHFYIMKKADENLKSGKSIEEFIGRFLITRSKFLSSKFEASFRKIGEEIYLPMLGNFSSTLILFSPDYKNRFDKERWQNENYVSELLNRKWKETDFQDKNLIDEGIQFGKDIWNTCVRGFNEGKKSLEYVKDLEVKSELEKTFYFGEEIIKYYSSIINE